ncbi:MAG: 8-oxoguanine DNA glycosylase [Oscillospiraceae bacterium]|nr:8-oxoguanine DNA glycosylase [Oscillospiraceae bacterium]
MLILKSAEHFNPAQIANSGQCFLWKELAPDSYEISAFGKTIVIERSGEDVTLGCSGEDYELYWRSYFDIDFDYHSCYTAAICSGFRYLEKAARYSAGIRILKQELWETTLSFIISQNNNIPRIRNSIKRVIDRYGHLPEPREITLESLYGLGLGYRDGYLLNAAESFRSSDFTETLKAATYAAAKRQLLSIRGIGNKVADCICLYGLGHKSAFPRDVWIRRIEEEHFGGHFPDENFAGYSGVLQQYLFYYGRAAG